MSRTVLLLVVALLLSLADAESTRASEPLHGLSVFGDLKYPADFAHFDYVNPGAPKGGTLRIPGFGTFFSLQPFIRQGRAPFGIERVMYDTLLTRAWDEPSALYGLLAESVELADDKSWIEFVLRPEARWHDGTPLTSDDVVFTVDILKEKGSPREKTLLGPVTGAETLGPHRVRIHLSGRATRQLPLQISGEMQILPSHYWATREFDKTTLEPPLGSGAYRIAEVDVGRRITFERVADYWAKDLNVNVGRFNFDRIQYKYYQDLYIQLEAVTGHEVDWRLEPVSKTWATAYDTPARRRGHFLQEVLQTQLPRPKIARVFNLRRKKFQDPRVREALTWAYNHEFVNEILYYRDHPRSRSYFQNSDMEHRGPPSSEELALLEPFRDQLDPRLFERQYDPPVAQAPGRNRSNMLIADRLLKEAGWIVREGVRVNADTGESFEFDIYMSYPEMSPTMLAFSDTLKQLGIVATLRIMFATEYQNLVSEQRDFDMVMGGMRLQLVPGAELRNILGSRAADRAYSRNTPGIRSPAVDSLIEKIIGAKSRAELVTAARALDRVLCWGFYYIDGGYIVGSRFAYWNIFGRPERQPRFATGFPYTWWIDSAKQEMIASGQRIEVDQAALH